MSLFLYNSLHQKLEAFHKVAGENVTLYACGPTVYDDAHLGHGRSAVSFDLLRFYLQFCGYSTTFVSNITDIDDKMIQRAEEEGISVKELAERIWPRYQEDYAKLGISPADKHPKATEAVATMIEMIQKLEEQGACYLAEDGVYFDIQSFPEYGKLSGQDLEALQAGSRVAPIAGKRQTQDFVLWKFKKEGEPFWPSPWGDGRPGWHIECSAMTYEAFGASFDIHGGGLDLKFPHHECEIAQSECAYHQPMARFWVHNGFITVNQEKMSKSLFNFKTLRDLFQVYNPRLLRFFLLSSHYRSPIEFNDELLKQSAQTLKKMDSCYLYEAGNQAPRADFKEEVQERMNRDLDVSSLMSFLHEEMQKGTLQKSEMESVNSFLKFFPVDFSISDEAQKILSIRQEARDAKNYAESDRLRGELEALGYAVEDALGETRLLPKLF